ncbi:MAG: deoxyribose-phosphate aldolase [Ilumatobacteraceae bacterium]|nr:deoxyribose-phosphate aldolase [Ilumatobacteraceae bacterium]
MHLTDDRWGELIATRADDPGRPLEMLRARPRRPLLTDGRLFIVAADHSARGMLGVPGEPFAMADRRRTLESLLIALSSDSVDGVLASADIMEELALLGALDGKLAFGTMNRGGIMGADWELDDRMTAYSAATIADHGLDGGKVLLRLADDDAGTAPTLEACARAVDECAAAGLPIMVEPLPYHHDPATGAAKLLDDDDALLRAVAIGSGLGGTSSATWLKVPAAKDPARMLACTTLPALILGGSPGPDPEATYASWERSMEVPNVRGLVVGRSLLYPADGDVEAAIDRAASIVRPS